MTPAQVTCSTAVAIVVLIFAAFLVRDLVRRIRQLRTEKRSSRFEILMGIALVISLLLLAFVLLEPIFFPMPKGGLIYMG